MTTTTQPQAASDLRTASANWRASGEPDPHGTRYDCERAQLMMGDLTDDELANAVYLHGDATPSVQDVLDGKAEMPTVYLAAAKDRIRWLSRQLEAALARPAPDATPAGADVEALRARIIQAISKACAGQGIHIDGHGVMSMHGGVWPRFHEAIDSVLRTHVLAPPASAADGEGRYSELTRDTPIELPDEAGRGLAGQVMDAAWPEFGGNNLPAEFWQAFDLAVRFTLAATAPSPVPPTRVAGLDREAVAAFLWSDENELRWHTPWRKAKEAGSLSAIGIDVRRTYKKADAICALAPTPGETPGQDAVAAAIEALEPFAAVAEHDIGSDETDADVFLPMDGFNRAPRLTVGHLRRARAALAAIAQGPGAGQAVERVRHVKSGGEYEVLGEAEVQISTRSTCPDGVGNGVLPNSTIIREGRAGYEGDRLVIYRALADGKLWCPFPDEFRDGRFVTAAPVTAASEGDAA